MTVKDLIKELQAFDTDMPVVLRDNNTGAAKPIEKLSWVNSGECIIFFGDQENAYDKI